ncbi:MAG: hypothetical protein KGJ60_15755 [Verrucomicrobiota bacterium]|nr:hypothetical protein [Verrucomicrobiota bacterium]
MNHKTIPSHHADSLACGSGREWRSRARVVGKKPFVDGEYPFNDPASAGMKKKFDLPTGRLLNA